MAAHKQGLEVANTELAKLSRTDRLTPLSNRGHWEEKLIAEFTRFKRYAVECTLVMFDIDHIKKVNDSFGHQAGDEVLRTMAQLLRKMVRTTDIVGRYGGEEFGVILASTGVEGGKYFADRLRKKVEKSVVCYEAHEVRFTISLGVAAAAEGMKDYRKWLEAADQALYTSKREGRNRCTVAAEV